MWLDAWLDNVMASIPEIAVCYHRNGVVQGYELLKTDDIFLLKGLSKDGTAFFHPHVVQQNASSVLRFLQENCKQDPGTYWVCQDTIDFFISYFLSVVANIITGSPCCFQKCGRNLGCEVCLRFCPRCGLLFNYLQPASGADDVNGESKLPVTAIHDEVDGLALCE
jgi:hypothetical protein